MQLLLLKNHADLWAVTTFDVYGEEYTEYLSSLENPQAGLTSMGGWDPSLVRTFDPDVVDRMSLGYYDPMMEAARAGAVSSTMSQYGQNFGNVLDPEYYENILRQQIAQGTLEGYQGVQGQQQAAMAQTTGVMDEWAQLISALGLGVSTDE